MHPLQFPRHRRRAYLGLLAGVFISGLACSGNQFVNNSDGAKTGGDSGPFATCQDGQKNQDESDVDCGGAICGPCGSGKACGSDNDCESKACSNHLCLTCKPQTVSCLGNLVRSCGSDGSTFSTLATCDPVKGEACDAATQKCVPLSPTGSPNATGTYYLFSMFKTGVTEFKGGNDVDSFVGVVGDSEQNLIYVNRSSQLDVYKVELVDTDKDGKLEPNQHPDNPDARGPIEGRKLTFVKTYNNVKLGTPSWAEIYASRDRIYFLRNDPATNAPNIYEFIFASGVTNLVAAGNPKLPLALLGFDDNSKRWFAGNHRNTRRVFSFYPDGGGWAAEFDYPNLAGSHMDGMEVVVDPKSKITYVYVSDMTSDFIAQYYRDAATGKWIQKNVFKYMESSSQDVEGMGFGAFQHFWMTSGSALYEVGGGDLQKFVGPD